MYKMRDHFLGEFPVRRDDVGFKIVQQAHTIHIHGTDRSPIVIDDSRLAVYIFPLIQKDLYAGTEHRMERGACGQIDKGMIRSLRYYDLYIHAAMGGQAQDSRQTVRWNEIWGSDINIFSRMSYGFDEIRIQMPPAR